MAIETKPARFAPKPQDEACPLCGQDGLERVNIGLGRWVLYDGMRRHECGKVDAERLVA